MIVHKTTSVLFVLDDNKDHFEPLLKFLDEISPLEVDIQPQLPVELSKWDVVVTSDDAYTQGASVRLTKFVDSGGGLLNFILPDTREIPAVFGAQPEIAGQQCELRVLFHRQNHPISVRLEDAIYVQALHHPLFLNADDAETVLYTDWQFQHKTVFVQRPYGNGRAACTTLWDFGHPVFCRILYRMIRCLGGCSMTQNNIGVGILGYAPSVGQYHGQGVDHTSGLVLHAACDLDTERLHQARNDFPNIRIHSNAQALCRDDDVDLVIVATPPNTHAELAMQMMAAGKHVVCEKPLALNSVQTSAMAETANRYGVHLSCHQNRRWDVDYLAIKQALAEGQIGDLFYLEAFVGGFSHPCGYWHSHDAVSGGTSYDWGGHYIDWIVSLFGQPIKTVSGTRQKRVWHDVTNADQECIQVRFHGGGEAQFIHSDIAAARKPKWYLLGTRGAIVGQWQDVTEYAIDDVHYFHRHDIPPTEMPPVLTLYQRHRRGKITKLEPAIPDRSKFGFHSNLADYLLVGEPLTAPLEDSISVVTVLEAAARSMASDGAVEVLNA